MSESKGLYRAKSGDWHCYLIECADGSYYVGVATDLQDRLREHNAGRGAKHTRLRTPVRLVWSRRCESYAEARGLETRLKGWKREKKRRLAEGSLRLPLDSARGHSG